jgi:hypothetical protein
LAAVAAAFHVYLNSSGRSSNEAHDPVFTAAIAENYREIDLNGIDCLSTKKDRATIFERDYSDHMDVLRLIEENFPGKRIAPDRNDCPFGIGFTIIKTRIGAVQYHGRPAEILMSFFVCTRRAAGQFNSSPCLSKNIYLFTTNVTPIQAFAIGLQALVREKESDWVVMNLSAPRNAQ